MTKRLSAIWLEQPLSIGGRRRIHDASCERTLQPHASIIEAFLGRQVSAISSGGVEHARIGKRVAKLGVF
jgi:hypothetical protein